MSLTQTRTKCILTIMRANTDHNGEYKCQASNSYGKATTQCHVNVLPAFQGMCVNQYVHIHVQLQGVSQFQTPWLNRN